MLTKNLHIVLCREEYIKYILNPPLYLPPGEATMSGAHADACGPLLIASYRAALDQDVPVMKSITSYA